MGRVIAPEHGSSRHAAPRAAGQATPHVLPRSRRAVLALAGAAALALTGCGGNDDDPATALVLRIAPGDRKPAPTVTGDLLTGGSYDLAAQRGKVVVLNFWASWCPPCRREAADLDQVYQAVKSSGVEFVGVNNRDDRDKAKAFESAKTSFPSIFDPAGRVALRFTEIPPTSTPSTLIIDRQGRVAAVLRKATTVAELTPIVREIAAEQAS
ncbi:TlpA family protein disulfide reductase [Catellatospora sp. NEAU-YM18]|nr:TlpA family protein disulfide reductase [Catellatospora tritici]